MAPGRIGIFPTSDVNHDGRKDAIWLQSGDTVLPGRNKKGRPVTTFVHQTTLQPALATEKDGIYQPFPDQDPCKTREDLARIKNGTYRDQGIFWRFEDPGIPFAAVPGATSFFVGQEVYIGDGTRPARIAYFRVAVQARQGQFYTGPAEAVFKGCQAAPITSLRPMVTSSK